MTPLLAIAAIRRFAAGFVLLAVATASSAGIAGQPPANGEELLTGTELRENCRPDEGEAGPTHYCMEFVFGLVQTLAHLQDMMPETEKLFCIDPEAIGLEEVTVRVVDWLDRHGERLDEPAFLLVSEALRDNYPCTEDTATRTG